MTGYLSALGGAGWQFLTDSGVPLAGGLLYTYEAGSTTPATTYTTYLCTPGTENANPIQLDAYGRPSAEIWFNVSTSYKFVLKTSTGTTIWTKDNIPGISAASDIAAFIAELAAAGGGDLVGHQRAEAGSILETVDDLLFRLDIDPTGFGALYNGVANDYTALSNFAAALSSASYGIARLKAGTLSFGQTLSTDMLHWAQDNAGLVGAGIDRTIIKNVYAGASGSYSLGFGDAENCYFSDMTFEGRTGRYDATNKFRNIIFNRCKFTTQAGTATLKAFQYTTGSLTEGMQYVYFIDCIFDSASNMGCEIQNGGAGTTVRQANVYFIRPRFLNNASIALSFDGYGEDMVVDQGYFDGNGSYALENAGTSRLLIKDMRVRASTMAAAPCIGFNNARPMYDCEVDGFQLVGDIMSNIVDRPAITTSSTPFVFSNAQRLKLNRINAAVDNAAVATRVVLVTNTGGACSDVSLTNGDLWSNSDEVMVEFSNSTGNQVVKDTIFTSTFGSRAKGLVRNTSGGTVILGGNRVSYASGTTATVWTKSGTGAIQLEYPNFGIAPVTVATTTTSPWAWNSTGGFTTQGYTALANALTISADAGSPYDGQKATLVFTDNGTSRTLTFTGGSSKAFLNFAGAALTVSGANWTYTTTASKTVYVPIEYNATLDRWAVFTPYLGA